MTEDSLRCSPADLVAVFRDALIASIPTAERLLLEWGDGRQHRDWERLARTLFDLCVRGPIESDSARPESEYPLAPYDIDEASYAVASWISATSETTSSRTALIRLMTDVRPFDIAQVAILDPETLVPIDRALLPFAEVEFAFVRRSKGQLNIEIREIEAID
ncbi:hypothetical protein [Cellulomonas sp. URHD0024]|uniref:hypothetical protein n=1 Tax=Cellulomonas sp. URHD0024 TaxID=1302620 RepID=UPI0012DD266D|nr:hypothetical protein [Cellulomonas sp. URHD0024]